MEPCVGETEVESCINPFILSTCTTRCIVVPLYYEGKAHEESILPVCMTRYHHQQLHNKRENVVFTVHKHFKMRYRYM